MARTKQTARKSTGGKAPRKQLAGTSRPSPPRPRPEHNYLGEARQLAGWRQRATEIDTSSMSANPDECLFDICNGGYRWNKIVLLFCKPDICVHFNGGVYRLTKQDFDGFVTLAHAAIAECAMIGNLVNGSGIGHPPRTTLRAITGTYTSSAGHTYPEFSDASFTSFQPHPLERHTPQAASSESSEEDPLPELHALTAILSLAYVGTKEDFNIESQDGPITQLQTMYENAIFGQLAEDLEEMEGKSAKRLKGEDEEEVADVQEAVSAQIESELQRYLESQTS